MPIKEELTNDAIIQSVLNPQEVQEIESDEEDSTMTQISWAEDSEGLKTFVKFAEKSKHYDVAQVMNLHIIQNRFCQKRAQSKKQVNIHTMFKRAQEKIQANLIIH